jgi:hypothetical protein
MLLDELERARELARNEESAVFPPEPEPLPPPAIDILALIALSAVSMLVDEQGSSQADDD